MDLGIPVTTAAELQQIIGIPEPRAANKARSSLHPIDREWLAAASLVFVATSDDAGNLDVSPKGDPAGPDAAPRRAVISQTVERQDALLEDLDAYYGPSYEERIYTG